MRNTAIAIILVSALLLSAAAGTQLIYTSSANPFIPEATPLGIQNTSTGTVEGTDKIQQVGNVYTLTSDLQETIAILCDGVVLDGAGYTIKGNGSGVGVFLQQRNGVTIKNLRISNFEYGIKFPSGWGYDASVIQKNNTISGNVLRDNFNAGIYINATCMGNTIVG